MMKYEEWFQRLQFFLDPKIKSFDKELWRELAQDLQKAGASWSEDLSSLKEDQVLPRSYLLMSDTNLKPSISQKDKVFVFGGANMSLFGRKEFAGEKRKVDSVEQWQKLFLNFDRIYENQILEAEKGLLEASQTFFKKISLKKGEMKFYEAAKTFSELEKSLLGALSPQEIQEVLAKSTADMFRSPMILASPAFAYKEGNSCFLPLKVGDEPRYLCWQREDYSEGEALYVYSLLEDLLEAKTVWEEENLELDDLQRVLGEAPLPLALFNKKKELVLHNALFIQLNLAAKTVLSLKDEEQFQRQEELYRVKRVEMPQQDLLLYYFYPVREFLSVGASPSSEELGIVSSSIAHELNNPLGGISGALDVLLLEERAPETEQSLKDMKAGVSRCKKLVETFLGFSKLDAKKRDQGNLLSEIESSFNSALDLIRFRLIENNISLEASCAKKAPCEFQFNPHVMSMLLYLILGDLLTSFGHQNLLEARRSANFSLILEEGPKKVRLTPSKGVKLGKDFLNSKLLNHLLELQSLRIDQKEGSVFLLAL